MRAQLSLLSPILWTKDLKGTIDFYTNRLGFKSQTAFPNFATLIRDEVQIMIIVPQKPARSREDIKEDQQPFFEKPLLTGSIYIFTKDIDELWESIKEHVKVKEPIEDREYQMRDFSIFDNNGYELVFGEDISGKLEA
jgi:catechol 2,3-dioxygenase-like lactoylglutathione lyase family enzyme